jgi:hypothetical protein
MAPETLLGDVRALIEETRSGVAATVNAALTLMYWRVGVRIRQDILGQGRAEYGKEILQTLSAKLVRDYGRGWSQRNLAYMVQFAEAFEDERIVVTLSRQLSWSHFLALIPLRESQRSVGMAQNLAHMSPRVEHKRASGSLL